MKRHLRVAGRTALFLAGLFTLVSGLSMSGCQSIGFARIYLLQTTCYPNSSEGILGGRLAVISFVLLGLVLILGSLERWFASPAPGLLGSRMSQLRTRFKPRPGAGARARRMALPYYEGVGEPTHGDRSPSQGRRTEANGDITDVERRARDARRFVDTSGSVLRFLILVAAVGAIPFGFGVAQECGLRFGAFQSRPSFQCETNTAMAIGAILGSWAGLAWAGILAFALLHIVGSNADQAETAARAQRVRHSHE